MSEKVSRFRNFKRKGRTFNQQVSERAKHVTKPDRVASRITGEIDSVRKENPEGKVVWVPGIPSLEAEQAATLAGIDNFVIFELGRVNRVITRSSQAIHGDVAVWKIYGEVAANVDVVIFDPQKLEENRALRETHWKAGQLASQGRLEIIYKDTPPTEAVA